MRLLSAAFVGVLIPVFALAVPTLTIAMESKQPDQGSIRPTITLSAGQSGMLDFRRYPGPSCSGSYTSFGSVSTSTSTTTYTGPDVQTGSLGQFSLWVRLRNTSFQTLDTKCFAYLVQRQVTATATLSKTVYDNNDQMQPETALANTTPDAGGQVELGRWTGSGCGSGAATSVGILPVVGGKPQGTVNMQNGVMGQYSFRATYSGDTKNSQATSACTNYAVGVYIRGKVFQDNDGSGSIDPGEEGIAGAMITVRKGQTPVGSATTSASGLYEILVTSAGTYTVSQTPPKGYEATGVAELTVQVNASTVSDRNFGVAQVPSTLLPKPTATNPDVISTGDPPRAQSSGSGYAVLSFVALGVVALAAIAMVVLVIALRSRNEGA